MSVIQTSGSSQPSTVKWPYESFTRMVPPGPNFKCSVLVSWKDCLLPLSTRSAATKGPALTSTLSPNTAHLFVIIDSLHSIERGRCSPFPGSDAPTLGSVLPSLRGEPPG